jgi:hypothetical protein
MERHFEAEAVLITFKIIGCRETSSVAFQRPRVDLSARGEARAARPKGQVSMSVAFNFFLPFRIFI